MSRVIIVGAGPGGATLAYLLASRGVEVALFERQTDFAREFRGEALLPGGLEPFEQMGLWERLETVPHVTLRAVALYLNGRHRARADFAAEVFGKFAPRWVSQAALLEMLIAEAGRHSAFRFERGASVRGLVTENGRVVGVRLSDNREVRGALVVGADGRSSIVRRRANLAATRDPIPMDIVWCKLPAPDFLASDPHIRAYLGRGHLLIAAPIYDGKMQIAWIISKGSFGEIRQRGMSECLTAMADHVSADLALHLSRYRDKAVQPFLLSTVSDRVGEWTRPGLLLIGDAAHTMSPVGAQGLNIAIRDAIVAANHLVPALRSPLTPERLDAATASIEHERLPEVAAIQRLQAAPPKVLLRDTWWSRMLLAVAPALLGSAIGRGRRGLLFRQFAFGVTDVRLIV